VAAIAMGIAEVAGTTLTMVAADRTGPARMSTWAMAACVPPLAILVSTPTNAVVAVGLFVILDLAIECSFVAVLPLVSELDPDNRARAISHAFVIITGSRAIGSVAAGWIYGVGGFAAISVVAAVVAAAATAALIAGRASRRPRDRRRTTPA
jgi:predicted MFS family arabinose efflux permease